MSGGDHWFESCDPEIQDEIRSAWAAIVVDEVEQAGRPVRECPECGETFDHADACDTCRGQPMLVPALLLATEEE
jgi:hypothetical protein